MSIPFELRQPLRALVHDLVAANYRALEADGRAGRLTAAELNRAVSEYGRTLVELPDDAFAVAIAAIPITGRTACWAVDLDLWTAEVGRSDLTLSLTACITPAGVAIQIDDLHVL